MRIHGVKEEFDGHVIREYRCLENAIETRSWMGRPGWRFLCSRAQSREDWDELGAPLA